MSQVYLSEHRGFTNWGDRKPNQHNSNQMLVFDERGKPEYPGKNLSEQSRESTDSTHIWRLIRESNLGHIGGRPVLSPLPQHCAHCEDHQRQCSMGYKYSSIDRRLWGCSPRTWSHPWRKHILCRFYLWAWESRCYFVLDVAVMLFLFKVAACNALVCCILSLVCSTQSVLIRLLD